MCSSKKNFTIANFGTLLRIAKKNLAMKFLTLYHLYVDHMCAKFQAQKVHTKKYIQNPPTCVVVRNNW